MRVLPQFPCQGEKFQISSKNLPQWGKPVEVVRPHECPWARLFGSASAIWDETCDRPKMHDRNYISQHTWETPVEPLGEYWRKILGERTCGHSDTDPDKRLENGFIDWMEKQARNLYCMTVQQSVQLVLSVIYTWLPIIFLLSTAIIPLSYSDCC